MWVIAKIGVSQKIVQLLMMCRVGILDLILKNIKNWKNMRKINEKDYVNFTIAASGWSFTVHKLADAMHTWAGMKFGTFYGNKPDGTRAIIDSK